MVEIDLQWAGVLTFENIDQVADTLRDLLTGRRFTLVSANELEMFKPRVKQGKMVVEREMHPGVYVNRRSDPDGTILRVSDTDSVWGCITRTHDESPDPTFENPHISFEGDRVTITCRAPSGLKLYWVVVVEKDQSKPLS